MDYNKIYETLSEISDISGFSDAAKFFYEPSSPDGMQFGQMKEQQQQGQEQSQQAMQQQQQQLEMQQAALQAQMRKRASLRSKQEQTKARDCR